jgi:hypothetical membrane protein
MDTSVHHERDRQNSIGRVLALGGAVGPVVFVADWAMLGLVRAGYSPLHDAISKLAELGTSTRPAMTAGFIIDGLGLAAYGVALRIAHAGPTWKYAVGTGLATLGVAAFPLGTPLSGKIHAGFALIGYVTLVGVPIAAASTGVRRGGPLSKTSVAAGLVAGAALVTSLFNIKGHGLAQRLGLTVGDVWVAANAIDLYRRSRRASSLSGSDR